jgi:hypothetical protein
MGCMTLRCRGVNEVLGGAAEALVEVAIIGIDVVRSGNIAIACFSSRNPLALSGPFGIAAALTRRPANGVKRANQPAVRACR